MLAVEGSSLKEKKRGFVRAVFEEAAIELFARSGFEHVTIDDIGRHAGVSRRTFFRYFKTKEDVIASSVRGVGAEIVKNLGAQPPGIDSMAALEKAFIRVGIDRVEADSRSHTLIGLVMKTPPIRATVLYETSLWGALIARELMRRRAFGGNLGRCELAAATSVVAFDYAQQRWLQRPKRALAEHIRQAFHQLRELGGDAQPLAAAPKTKRVGATERRKLPRLPGQTTRI